MKKQYTKDDIFKILNDHNLTPLEEITIARNKILCKTNDGYLVYAYPNGIMRRNDKPSIFSKYNPNTIYNIHLWLKINQIDSLELISTEFVNSSEKLKWICKNCGNEFYASWRQVYSGNKRYCNFCAKSKRFDDFRDYTNAIKLECENREYILLSEYIHRGHDKFDFICNLHRDYGIQTTTYDRLINRNQGCRYCGIEKRGIKHRMDEDKIKALVETKGLIYHGVNYDNDDKIEKKVNIEVICPKHKDKGIQIMKYYNLLVSSGQCMYCRGYGRTQEDLQKELDDMESHIQILRYEKYSEPIFVKCTRCGHEWMTTGSSLSHGHRCKKCYQSKFEMEVEKILKQYNIEYQYQMLFYECRDKNPLPFDFYLIDYNTLIEVDGEGHFIPIRRTSAMTEDEAIENLHIIQYHDSIKTDYCKNNNINLIRIPFWERNNVEDYLMFNLNNTI